jgi:hypothetical protein
MERPMAMAPLSNAETGSARKPHQGGHWQAWFGAWLGAGNGFIDNAGSFNADPVESVIGYVCILISVVLLVRHWLRRSK